MAKKAFLSAKELRAKKEADLNKILEETYLKLAQDQIALRTKKIKDTNILSKHKKLLAKVKTVLREKELLANIKNFSVKN